jgi:hypothetical protein
VELGSGASGVLEVVPGWNLVTLPIAPNAPFTAQSLLDALNAQGGACIEINRWLNGGWNGHPDGAPFNDFDIVLGEGYFLLCSAASSMTYSGQALGGPVDLALVPGWNLVGVPYPAGSYTAQSLLDDINAQGGACTEIDRWLNGGWDGHVDGFPFNDFPIETDQGYFILCSGPGSFSPTAGLAFGPVWVSRPRIL